MVLVSRHGLPAAAFRLRSATSQLGCADPKVLLAARSSSAPLHGKGRDQDYVSGAPIDYLDENAASASLPRLRENRERVLRLLMGLRDA